ncbi:hypothetical protein [Nitrosomonas sp. GH22]|uniref:hypothetical protein n=1 Tax=Nitrosomonas sp. GH22 TaxID=153947 RepID=UPI00136BC268|nr:hypothetical protein [Nitrosomonas sp. GH22]
MRFRKNRSATALTLTVQFKAPIRSHVLGRATLGECLGQIDRSTQRHHFANPNTGQIKPGIPYHIKLSIPTISLAAHAANEYMSGQSCLILRRHIGYPDQNGRISPGAGLRCWITMFSVLHASSAGMLGAITHPTLLREN